MTDALLFAAGQASLQFNIDKQTKVLQAPFGLWYMHELDATIFALFSL